ncbi:MAG: CopG family transcriptional regulator [Thermotogae bacterium]|nr:CopG family transcriptional regulator [Thermotogota bacterium]
MTIKIPRPLYEKLKQIIQGTSYSSVTEFVVYVLRDLVASEASSSAGELELTKEEIAAIKRRLRKLGYID